MTNRRHSPRVYVSVVSSVLIVFVSCGSSFSADPLPEVTVIKLTVDAKAAPVPALKYSLLPELKDMQQGNSVQAFCKSLLNANKFYSDKEVVENREKWNKCPLAELPNNLLDYGGGSLRQADYAARLDVCDWQILNQLKKEGIWTPFPDLTQFRPLASALKVRYRAQIKAGKFDDAVKTHQTIFAIAQNLGQHPTLIGGLVGIAVLQNEGIDPFQEMIQQPGCPNFYWALVQIPSNLIDIRQSMQGERLLVLGDAGILADPDRVWSESDVAQAREKAEKSFHIFQVEAEDRQKPKLQLSAWINDRIKDEKWLAKSRGTLVEAGLPGKLVAKYPPEQVIFNILNRQYEIARDERLKLWALPYWQIEDELLKEPRLSDVSETERYIALTLLPSKKAFVAYARIEMRLAMLRIIEALRIHAAENGGKLPASLSDVKLPLPLDPITGKPFNYKLENETAILRSTAPKGYEKIPRWNIRYEISIRK